MRFDILTLFPEMFPAVLNNSIIGKAQLSGAVEINYINIRDFAANKHKQADDYPYGGGVGMVMLAQPIYDAYNSVAAGLSYKPFTIYLTPQGKLLRQGLVKTLAKREHIILLCGHYEGVDQRVLDTIVDMEISIGDFILTGGEIAAMAVVDSVCRLNVLSKDAYTNESFTRSLLEHPHYTRPQIWNGIEVPPVLLSGNHKEIDRYRLEESIRVTREKRKSLLRGRY